MTSKNYACRTVRHMLPLHVGGDLDPRHVEAVDVHLKTCLSCFREFREFASMRSRLGVLAEERLPEGVLEGFVEEVMARIEVGEPGPAAEAPGQAGIRMRWPVLPRLAAAAALLIVCAAGWRYMTDGAITPLDRPRAVNPLPPSNAVSQTPAPTAQPSIPYGALRMPTSDRGNVRGLPSTLPPGMQGVSPLSQEELSLVQRTPDGGVIILIQRGQGDGLRPVEPTDDAAEAPKRPRKR